MPPPLVQRCQLKSHQCTWKPYGCKKREKGSEFVRLNTPHHLLLNPLISFGTIAWRGTKQLKENTTAYWEFNLESTPYGTSVQFGIGRANILNHSYDFVDLLGMDGNSYGLNHKGYAQRQGTSVRVCKPLEGTNLRIGLLFDGPRRSLTYFLNDQFICTPFVNVDLSQTLFPFVSSTAQCTSIRLANQYSREEVLSLFSISRRKAREAFSSDTLAAILPHDLL